MPNPRPWLIGPGTGMRRTTGTKLTAFSPSICRAGDAVVLIGIQREKIAQQTDALRLDGQVELSDRWLTSRQELSLPVWSRIVAAVGPVIQRMETTGAPLSSRKVRAPLAEASPEWARSRFVHSAWTSAWDRLASRSKRCVRSRQPR